MAGEVDEDEFVGKLGLAGLSWLRAKGLLTYPSPLLGGLLEDMREVLAAEVLPLLDPTDLAVLAQMGPPWLALVVSSGLPRAGKSAGLLLKLREFVGSVARPAWAKEIGCPWHPRTCGLAAHRGQLEVLQWAREHECPWSQHAPSPLRAGTWRCCSGRRSKGARGAGVTLCPCRCGRAPGCVAVAAGSRVPVGPELRVLRAAAGGHLAMLQWARERGCVWDPFDVC